MQNLLISLRLGTATAQQPVYDLTVADAHLFYANGILSSNTTAEDHAADDARYACMSRPWVRSIDKDEFEKRDAYQEASDVIGDEGIKLL